MNSGLSMHCHHDALFELCYNLEERQAYISNRKPQEERSLRLRLLQIVPPERLPAPLVNLIAEFVQLFVEKDSPNAEWNELNTEGARFKAEWDKLDAKWNKSIRLYTPELLKLHEELCPDCPWDGKTIFTRKDTQGIWY